MKVLHVAPHLGGGVGKAHAAIRSALPDDVEQTFVLLEEARDRRFVMALEARGVRVVTARNLAHVAELAAAADIVQFEFWNHPRLFECLARTEFPAIRSVFWSHVSGLSTPVIQPGLFTVASRFVFTTEASRSIPSLALLPEAVRRNISVINSGFGLPQPPASRQGREPHIAYLGTVDFVKMHPGFFDVVDRLEGLASSVSVWGKADPAGEVMARARAMEHPDRVHFEGHTGSPAAALGDADIFFYPLRPGHYGTAENALVEAMALGLVPVVLSNPAEMAIVRHGETGLVAQSIDESVDLLQTLLASMKLRETLSRNAADHVANTRSPECAAREFATLWQGLLEEPKSRGSFHSVIGVTPAEWFLAAQRLHGERWQPDELAYRQSPSKGTLAHFESAFPGDPSLQQLAVWLAKFPGAAA